MAEAVLKTHDLDFCSRHSLRGAMRLSYNALDLAFSPYTDYWKEMRKLCVVHLFSRVQKYRPIREDEVGRLVEKKKTNYRLIPSLSLVLKKHSKEHDTFYQQLIDEHLDPNRLIPQEEDLLDVLLRIRMDREFPLFELTIDHIKIVFIAGTDTAAATVIWVMIALMKNPECLKKTQAEVRDLVGKKGFVNEDDVQGLTYLKAVVKETFRLHPTIQCYCHEKHSETAT
ncbi:Premnaspirodiene oxygenase [Gossypium arboreum]|uniref:Premnaspirodiene oxygenase n=1 Tax=Gossypium arboreum TaxID=29729 RepID=A0A0B0NIJ7_GOSAR|nr:Premnaspirodiene oxygenase [Gossypium arboreum]